MSQLLAKWTDFSKGEAGWMDKAAIPAGYFTGEQVMLYRDGSIGPRSGVIDLGPTGLPAGALQGIGYVHIGTSGATNYVWIHKGTTIGRIPVYNTTGKVLGGQAFAACAGSFAAVPPGTAIADYVDYSPTALIIAVDADKAYVVDWTVGANGTLTALTGSPGGAHVELFNEFLLLAGNPTFPNRVWYSAPGNFNSWPAGNFFDISGGLTGTASPVITCLRRLRDMILIFTDIGQLFICTNLTSDPTTLQIRQFLPGDVMSGPRDRAIVRDRVGNIWFTRRDELPFIGDQNYGSPTAVPVAFDGATRREYIEQAGYLRQPDYSSDRLSRTAGVPGRHQSSVVLTDQAARALIWRNGTWSRHRLPAMDGGIVGNGIRGEMFLMDAAHTTVYAWLFEFDRPPYKFAGGATDVLPWSAVDLGSPMLPLAWAATPEFRPVNGDAINVERVEVLLTSHETGDSVNNHLDVFVQQYDKVDANEKWDTAFFPPDSETSAGAMVANGVTIGCANAFDEAAVTGGRRRRVAFYVNPDGVPAMGVRVLLRGLRGVSIHEIHLFGDTIKTQRP